MRLLPPPSGFSPDERDVWNAAQKQLRAQATRTGRSDVPLLESYCRNAVAARQARAAIASCGGAFQTNTTDRLVVKEFLKVATDAEAAVHRLGTALLLTPESRKRHGIKADGGGAEDELKALLS
jgi:P27 family predicted phage terminase small subunit